MAKSKRKASAHLRGWISLEALEANPPLIEFFFQVYFAELLVRVSVIVQVEVHGSPTHFGSADVVFFCNFIQSLNLVFGQTERVWIEVSCLSLRLI
jgi:hypothetical protein